ncbi:MAG: hypothetical protein WBA22_03995 [Candidatus Methanofastidiosia archaeon]
MSRFGGLGLIVPCVNSFSPYLAYTIPPISENSKIKKSTKRKTMKMPRMEKPRGDTLYEKNEMKKKQRAGTVAAIEIEMAASFPFLMTFFPNCTARTPSRRQQIELVISEKKKSATQKSTRQTIPAFAPAFFRSSI